MKVKGQTSTEFIILTSIVGYLIFFVISLAITIPDLTYLESDIQTRQYYATLPLAILDVYYNSTHTELLFSNTFKETVILHSVIVDTNEYVFEQSFFAGSKNFVSIPQKYDADILLWANYTLYWSNITRNISYEQKYPLN